MTPDNRPPRRRRWRRRRPGAEGANPPAANGNVAQPNGNAAYSNARQFGGGDGPGGRRRRSRRRNKRGGVPQADMTVPPSPSEIPSSELVPASGVLWIKPNGAGML